MKAVLLNLDGSGALRRVEAHNRLAHPEAAGA